MWRREKVSKLERKFSHGIFILSLRISLFIFCLRILNVILSDTKKCHRHRRQDVNSFLSKPELMMDFRCQYSIAFFCNAFPCKWSVAFPKARIVPTYHVCISVISTSLTSQCIPMCQWLYYIPICLNCNDTLPQGIFGQQIEHVLHKLLLHCSIGL